MSRSDLSNLYNILNSLDFRIETQIDIYQKIVDEHAVAQMIAQIDYDGCFDIPDFCYYCFTKTCKSLMGVSVLLRNCLPEDAMTLLRTMYESYLSVAYLLNNPSSVDEFVQKKVGMKTGHYQNALSKKGNPLHNLILDTDTGDLLPFGISTRQLAEGTRYQQDRLLHPILYSFLSEHVHPHMMASGNYRSHEDESQYSYKSAGSILQASLYAVYIGSIMLWEVQSFGKLCESCTDAVKIECVSSPISLYQCLNFMSFTGEFSPVPGYMTERLRVLTGI